jgi:hypothetical protein
MEKKLSGNIATNGRDAFKNNQSDGVKNYSDHHWGPFKPQPASPNAYKDRQATGQRGFGTFPKKWW